MICGGDYSSTLHSGTFGKIKLSQNIFLYRTRAIINRRLYIFYPIFKDNFFVFKEVFSEFFILMYGLYSRAAYDGAHTV